MIQDLAKVEHPNGQHRKWLEESQQAHQRLASTPLDDPKRAQHQGEIARLNELLGNTPALSRRRAVAQVQWLREYHKLDGARHDQMFDTLSTSIRMLID